MRSQVARVAARLLELPGWQTDMNLWMTVQISPDRQISQPHALPDLLQCLC